MERQTDIAQTIELAADRARYDECAKKLLTYKAVIAWILKSCTKEFSQYSVKFICNNCLNENVELSEHAVHQDQLNRDDTIVPEWFLSNMERSLQMNITRRYRRYIVSGYVLTRRRKGRMEYSDIIPLKILFVVTRL